MSLVGRSRRFDSALITSGLPRGTDIVGPTRLVPFVPIPEVFLGHIEMA